MWIKRVYITRNSLTLPLLYRINVLQCTNRPISSPTLYSKALKNQNSTFLNKSFARRLNLTQQTINEIKSDENCNSFVERTHTCGELRPVHDGMKVTLCGWVQFTRLSKFLLLRDSYGITQCMVSGNNVNLSDIPLETVVRIQGTVTKRPPNTINSSLSTGEVEVIIESLEVLNTVDTVPFNLREYQKPKEQLRLQHRYIDLRFPEMQSNLRQRSHILHNMRKFLVEKHSFVEVETPTLFCRTPGGAREFIVPTHHKGLFYSLVQSPQQFKQMLMSGGIDRYFQVARCYRDESTRADRQPEFTQLDIELSFTNLNSILTMIEDLLYETFTRPLPRPPFERLTYKEALETYGTDKPNVTYGLKLQNLSNLFKNESDLDFGAFAIPYPKQLGKLTAKYKESIRVLTKNYKVKVVLYENIGKDLGIELGGNIESIIGQGNAAVLAIGNSEDACLCLGEIRELLASLLKSQNMLNIEDALKPLWVVDFPLFVKDESGLKTCHHPFTAPHPEDLHLLDTEPLRVRSLAYDIVLNGYEIGGGSVRVHNAGLQIKLLEMLNIDPKKLSHFINALKSGCPPHAGIALGIDRLMTVACNAESIREVIAFPKSHDGRDPLSGAPNVVSEEDKSYYHISTVK